MNAIAVTGATGLLGAHFLCQAVSHYDRVIALYRTDFSQVKKIFEKYNADFGKVEWRKADLLNPVELEESLLGVSQVFHLAAEVDFQANPKLIEYNEQLTANVVNACLHLGIKDLIHMSSVAALGRKKQGELKTEEAQWENSKQNSVYAISKFRAEMEAWRGMVEGLQVTVIAPPIILAPGFWSQSSGQILPRVANGLPFFTLGENGFVDVRDLARATILLSNDPQARNEKFIICGHNTSYQKLFNEMALATNAKKPSIHLSSSLGKIVVPLEWLRSKITGSKPLLTKETLRSSQGKYAYSSQKLLSTLKFEFTPFTETIQWMADWYKSDHPTTPQ